MPTRYYTKDQDALCGNGPLVYALDVLGADLSGIPVEPAPPPMSDVYGFVAPEHSLLLAERLEAAIPHATAPEGVNGDFAATLEADERVDGVREYAAWFRTAGESGNGFTKSW